MQRNWALFAIALLVLLPSGLCTVWGGFPDIDAAIEKNWDRPSSAALVQSFGLGLPAIAIGAAVAWLALRRFAPATEPVARNVWIGFGLLAPGVIVLVPSLSWLFDSTGFQIVATRFPPPDANRPLLLNIALPSLVVAASTTIVILGVYWHLSHGLFARGDRRATLSVSKGMAWALMILGGALAMVSGGFALYVAGSTVIDVARHGEDAGYWPFGMFFSTLACMPTALGLYLLLAGWSLRR
ncbi:MAG TPA: hypothetical protein VEU47_01555 [Candidatus Cybelea sp.]|nr:hypothetical protein [Candidatus Cybelea sp.]